MDTDAAARRWDLHTDPASVLAFPRTFAPPSSRLRPAPARPAAPTADTRRAASAPRRTFPTESTPLMLAFSLLLFVAVLAALATAASRGLSHLDQILEVVDLGKAEPDRAAPPSGAEG